MKRLVVLALLLAYSGPTEPKKVEPVVIMLPDGFYVSETSRWEYSTSSFDSARAKVSFTVGYTGKGATGILIFESILYFLSPEYGIGEMLDTLTTEIPSPGETWEKGDVVWDLSHVTEAAYLVSDDRRYAMLHRLMFISPMGRVMVAQSMSPVLHEIKGR